MKNTLGHPVSGGDFFDRDEERRRIWRAIDADHLLLLAPRRVGKTSLMRRLLAEAAANDFVAVYFTVGDVNSELTFVERCYLAVANVPEAKSLLGQLKKGRVLPAGVQKVIPRCC